MNETIERKPYPIIRVVLGYIVIGGSIGGFLTICTWLFYNTVVGGHTIAWNELHLIMLGMVMYGCTLGCIPAILVAIKLIKQKQYSDVAGVVLFKYGCVSSMICTLCFYVGVILIHLIDTATLLLDLEVLAWIVLSASFLGVIGGMSSWLTGRLVLPKR